MPWMGFEIYGLVVKHFLGVKVTEIGETTIAIYPDLRDLEWVEGTYPTVHGLIKVSDTRQKDGSLKTEVDAP